MAHIRTTYARDLDLNLLRVFAVVADEGSVTRAAERLYLTQPSVSSALKRLESAVGQPLFARQGRGIVLTARGVVLAREVRASLGRLVDAAFSPASFDPMLSDRTIRLGVSDAAESWLVPPLLRMLEKRAPHMTLIILPVQFRTVVDALASQRIDAAITVADDLPAGTRRLSLFQAGFVCLYDGRMLKLPRALTLEKYLEHEHVVVSYNGDTRGVVEDLLGVQRRVRCSVGSFQSIGTIVTGSSMLATVPEVVAWITMAKEKHLRLAALPFADLGSAPLELLWRSAVDDDEAQRFIRDAIIAMAKEAAPRFTAHAARRTGARAMSTSKRLARP